MEQRVRKPEVRTGLKNWKCDQCASMFHRIDHMKRHALTRHTAKTHICSFCDSGFSRGDVLRRHWKSCKARVNSGHAIPEPERGGKHKRACDSCASLRKACNGKLPCAECNRREKDCTYQRLVDYKLPLPSMSQAIPDNQNAESPPVKDHTPQVSEPRWDLGPATLYPPTMKAVARRNTLGLG